MADQAMNNWSLFSIGQTGEKYRADDKIDNLRKSASQEMSSASADKAGEERESWGKVWYDFTQSTTLHGMNMITADTPYFIRRIVWILLVLGGVGLFLYQLTSSYLAYLDYPVTVNVKINYNDTLRFPAITLCNQNDFRSTASAGIGRYKLVRDYYSSLHKGGIDLEKYNATDMNLAELYEETAHRAENMIVRCEWDKDTVCTPAEDFVTTRTDYGYCYTYNSASRPGGPLEVSTTGVDRGLKVTLNIEQYEYMLGPNPGAGIKLLIHEQDELPLVGDLGQAIPPGSYAFVSLATVTVKNKKPPHGICNDSTRLDYYNHYSVSACKIECKMKYMIKHCGCREVYMPSVNGFPPICDLSTHQDCYQKYSMDFSDENCTCPVPCLTTMFSSSISYASISNFDVQRFLQDNGTDALRMRYVEAREIRQRMEEESVAADTWRIGDYARSVSELQAAIHVTFDTLINRTKDAIRDIVDDLEVRKAFHLHKGLGLLHYTTVNEFVRGFDLRDERTFSIVTRNYYEVVAILEEHAPKVADPALDAQERFILYRIAMAELLKLKTAGLRAIDQMNEVLESYQNATSLASYKVTPNERYDEAYISKDILGTIQQQEQLGSRADSYRTQVQYYLKDINIYEEILEAAYVNLTYDEERMRKNTEREDKGFIYRVERINYYRYVIRERHAAVPQEITQGLIDDFTDVYDTVVRAAGEADMFMSELAANTGRAEAVLSQLSDVATNGELYLAVEINKTALAEVVTSQTTDEALKELKIIMDTLTGDFNNVDTRLSTLQAAVEALWTNMLSEHTLYRVYAQIREDVEAVNADMEAEGGALKDILAALAGVDRKWLMEHPEKLYQLMNADFPVTTVRGQMAHLVATFSPLRDAYQLAASMREADTFYKAHETLRSSMQAFLDNCKIDHTFFRENFMQLGIFMSQLNYEEIEQQEAYSSTNLWSDIGGSLGLFIGASILTVCEVIDAIVHTTFKFYLCKRRQQPTLPDKGINA